MVSCNASGGSNKATLWANRVKPRRLHYCYLLQKSERSGAGTPATCSKQNSRRKSTSTYSRKSIATDNNFFRQQNPTKQEQLSPTTATRRMILLNQ
mmetsp:Transcript_8847/g.13094  ORF Transcript_8847/g.13094 Transcript_8847/m.13094 type:complete len:96 (-) Transcript_8847:494-781(-)